MIDGCESDQTSCRTDLADRLIALPEVLSMDDIRSRKFLTDVDVDAFEARRMEKWCQELADERLAAHGWNAVADWLSAVPLLGSPSLSQPRCDHLMLCCNSGVSRGFQRPKNVGVFLLTDSVFVVLLLPSLI
jgi:hypothetical protein